MKISEIYNIEKGNLQSSKNTVGEFPFITAAKAFKTHNTFDYDCEALIFACAASGSLGRTHYFKGQFISSDLCFVLTLKDEMKEKILPKFHYYYLNFERNHIVRQTKTGTSKAAINKSNFSKIEIPIPDIKFQKELVSKLEAIEKEKKQIEILNQEQESDIKNLLYSTYTDIIKGAKEKPMVEVAPIIRRPVQITAEENYPELGIRCFGNGTFHKPALTGIEVGTKKLFQIKTGDLVFSNVFAWEGGIAIAKENDNDRYGSHRFISCNCDLEQVNPSFLNFHFLAPKGLLNINNCSPGGAGRNKTLGLKKLEAIKVPVPKIEQQEKFEKLLHQFETLKTEKETQEKELSVLIPSLLDKAFKREL